MAALSDVVDGGGQEEGEEREDVHYRDGVVIEDSGHIFRWKLVGGVGYQQTRLAHRTVSNNDTSVLD
jgi:hypothetical protein